MPVLSPHIRLPDEEYDVILEQEKIAVLPLSIVRQLEIGDLIQLTGKVLKVLHIEEKKAALEVWIEESNELASKELVWGGVGPATPFELVQKMGVILLDKYIPQGLLNRTRKLLEKEREQILDEAQLFTAIPWNLPARPAVIFLTAIKRLFQKAFQSTVLKSLWAMRVCWTSIQTVLQTHFLWPIHGQITSEQVGACLGLSYQTQPLSLYHRESFAETSFDLYREIWSWCLCHVKSRRVVSFEGNKAYSVPLIHAYLAMHHREYEYRQFDILEFQKNSLSERIKQFRAIGPMRFLGNAADRKCYQFSISSCNRSNSQKSSKNPSSGKHFLCFLMEIWAF